VKRYRSIVVALALSLGTPAFAFAQASVFPPGAGTYALTGRGPTTAELAARINAMSARPVPSPPPQPVVRPDMVWVGTRYVAMPGAPDGVLVPGHWERQLPNGQLYVPPLAIVDAQGRPGLVNAGERAPLETRIGP
jgi:hypothetical protein